jgi:hypothetical protein
MPHLLWHPARDAELVATYRSYIETGTLLVKESGSGSNYTQAEAPGSLSSAAWDDDPGVYILASLLGDLTGSESPYPGLKVAQALLVALPLLWLPYAVARVFKRARAGYSLILIPPILWLVNNGTILLGTQYGLSDAVSSLRVYALYGLGASLTFLSLSLLLLLSTFRFKIPALFAITLGLSFLAGLGNLTRSYSGVGIALAVGVLWWINLKRKPRVVFSLAGSAIALAIAMVFGSTIMANINTDRAEATGQNLSELPDSHGTWHPLYLGLSYPEPITGQPSELGIPWSDEFGWNVAKSANPDVVIASEEYDFYLRDAFWEAVSNQPVEAAQTYVGKLLFVIKHFGAMIFVIVLGLGLGFSRAGKHRKRLILASIIPVPSLLFGLVPPVLVMPLLYYFSELSAALGLLLALSVGSLVWYLSSLPGFIRTTERIRISKRIKNLDPVERTRHNIGVIIPCRNGEEVIEQTVRTLQENLSSSDEIIVVENGSSDNTAHVLARLKKNWNSQVMLTVLTSEPGLGNALRTGVIASRSKKLLLTADDLPFGVSDLMGFKTLDPDVTVAIGSKAHRLSQVNRTNTREFQSQVFRFMRSAFLQSGVGDSQGTIWVTGPWARTFAILSHEKGLMWTTELVMAAEQQGKIVTEVPVTLSHSHSLVKSRFGLSDAFGAIASFARLAMYKEEYSQANWEDAQSIGSKKQSK